LEHIENGLRILDASLLDQSLEGDDSLSKNVINAEFSDGLIALCVTSGIMMNPRFMRNEIGKLPKKTLHLDSHL
jgi:hypothetical protein